MPLDPYAPCPCGSGKKLKFCCADLAGEIEKIHRMVEGDQPHAALRHVDQSLAAHPNRASLLDLKATLELALDDVEAATATVDTFLATHPGNSRAEADRALLLARKGDARTAIEALQLALSGIDRDMPRRVLEAIGAVGHAALLAGQLAAAQAHLWLYTTITPEDDMRGLELLVRLNQSGHLPLLLRERLMLRDWPQDAPWADQAAKASEFAAQGKWLQAVAIVDQLGQQYGADPALVYNRALLGGWLADERALSAGLHAFAQLDVALDEAVEAEAIAQLLDPEVKDPTIDSVEQTYDVVDLDKLAANLRADPRAESYEIDPSTIREGTPPPRHAFVLLDKPMPTNGEEIEREQVPLVIGFISIYARQTDRPERLMLLTDRGEHFDRTVGLLAEIGGDALGSMTDERIIAKISLTEQALSWRWLFPDDTPPARRRTLTAAERQHAIVARWPDVPRGGLGGKTPREAKDDASLRIPLMAAVLALELGSNNVGQEDAFRKLRDDLGLPQPGLIECTDEEASHAPVYQVPRLPIESLSDETLVQLYRRAMMAAASAAIGVTLRESLRRPSVSGQIPRQEAYQRLIAMEDDPTAAFELLEEARQATADEEEFEKVWDLMEVELHLNEGEVDHVERLLRSFEGKYGDDADFAAAVYEILNQAGVLPTDEIAGQTGEERDILDTGVEGGGIWTPDSERQAGDKPAIWTPS